MAQMNWDRFDELVGIADSGNPGEAIAGLKELLDPSESGDDNACVLMIIGRSYIDSGRYEEARKALTEARAMAMPHDWVDARCLYYDALIDAIGKKWKDALSKLDSIIADYGAVQKPRPQGVIRERWTGTWDGALYAGQTE